MIKKIQSEPVFAMEKDKKNNPILTEGMKAEMLKLRKEGLSFLKIAEHLNVSYKFVVYNLQKFLPQKHNEEFQNMILKISELKDQRMKNKEIAATLGLSLPNLFYYIQKSQTLSTKRFAPREKIVEAFKAGKNPTEIANEIGFDESITPEKLC